MTQVTDVTIEKNQGEIKVVFNNTIPGVVTFEQLGLSDEDLVFESGMIRMVFDLHNTNKDRSFCHVPTIEVAYSENMGETHWVCDFNEETILDKLDHRGHSTVLLMNRNTLEGLEHHHQNNLIMHAEFPQAVHVIAKDSFINFFN